MLRTSLVRGTNTKLAWESYEDGTPAESPGVRAVFDALRDGPFTDEQRLSVGSRFCEALYAYCREAAG